MKTAVVYARVSDKKQADADISVPSQIEAAHKKAADLGATVAQVFRDDGLSAFKPAETTRPQFNEAIDYACTTSANYFIVWSSARFARNRVDAALAKSHLDRAGCELVYISMPIDRRTDAGWLLDGITELFDENTSRRISQDTRRSMSTLAQKGYRCGGRPPFGYRSTVALEDPRRKRLVIRDDEAPLVREIFQLRVRGSGPTEIARLLNSRGWLRRGKRWAKKSVLAVLQNRSMIGQQVFGRRPAGATTLKPIDLCHVVDSHEPIIDRDLWDRVQEILKEAADACASGSPHSRHPFTGLLVCSGCGGNLVTRTAKGRNKRYSYYVCERAEQKRCASAFRRLRADQVDEWLTEEILGTVLTPKNLQEIGEALLESANRWERDRDDQLKAVNAQLKTLRKAQSNLYDILELHGRDAPNLGDLTERMRDNVSKEKALKAEKTRLENATAPALELPEGWLQDLADSIREMLSHPDNAARARGFYGGFVRRIVVDQETVTVKYDPARLIPNVGPVHSGLNWLPKHDLLRTRTLPLLLPPVLVASR